MTNRVTQLSERWPLNPEPDPDYLVCISNGTVLDRGVALRAKNNTFIVNTDNKSQFSQDVCINVNLQNTLTTTISENFIFKKINRLQTKKRRITTLNTGLIQKAKIHVILLPYPSFDVGRQVDLVDINRLPPHCVLGLSPTSNQR